MTGIPSPDPKLAPESIGNAWPPSKEYRLARWVVLALATLLISVVYSPVRHGGFVWDDIINFLENDWLRTGSQWQHYIFRDFNGWINYFRPLGVVLFTVQVRLFDNQPGPMHLVSLAMHLFNTVLVSILAAQVMRPLRAMKPGISLAWLATLMLFYGLHPVLIEAVAWIGVQFDQLATGFMLLGTCAALGLRRTPLRPSMIGLCFFLALCAKESAVVFPLLVLLVDWAVYARAAHETNIANLRIKFLQRNLDALVSIAMAFAAYLVFRYFGLGHLLQQVPVYGGDLSLLGSIQKVSWTYLSYLKLILYPWIGLSPIHSFDPISFQTIRPALILSFVALSALLLWSLIAMYMRASAAACLILVVSSALLPVLNILPTGFALSLYHERYAINALAFSSVLLPLLPWPTVNILSTSVKRLLLWASALVWIASSVLVIRATLPLWLDDESLWRWAIEANPTSEIAQYNFVAALLRNNRLAEANVRADQYAATDKACVRCDIEIARVELSRGDTKRAESLAERIRSSPHLAEDLNNLGDYYLIVGRLALAEHNYAEATELLTQGIELLPEQLPAQVDLAKALLGLGRIEEALSVADTAIELADDMNRSLIIKWRRRVEETSRTSPLQNSENPSDRPATIRRRFDRD